MVFTMSIYITFCSRKNDSRHCSIINLKAEPEHSLCLMQDEGLILVEDILPGRISYM